LITASSNSSVWLNSADFTDISATDNGLISIQKSFLVISASYVAGLNVSFIEASESSVSILDSEIADIQLGGKGKLLSLVHSGALVSCSNCPTIVLSATTLRDISANKGGVVYSKASDLSSTSSLVVTKGRFERCSAETSGGVLSTENYNVDIVQCSFTNNTSVNGGVVHFLGNSQKLLIQNNSFAYNSALIAGSCIRWVGLEPALRFNNFSNNSALYGNPQASVPHHFLLLTPGSLEWVADFPLQGVTGQRMEQPLLVGVFDIMDQLITSDNSTFVYALMPAQMLTLGSRQIIVTKGIASFSFVFLPFFVGSVNLSFASPSIVEVAFEYRFRDCQAGEIRTERGCFPCAKNSYSLQPSDLLCLMCPAHTQCYGRTELVLDAEYWRASNWTDVIYPCLVPGSCKGGADSECAPGYRGPLCNSCVQGYYRLASWQCTPCEHEFPAPARGVCIVLIVIAAATAPAQLFLAEEGARHNFFLAMRQFITYAQTIMFVTLLHAKWGFSVLVHNEILRVIGSLGGLLVYADCQDAALHYFQVVALSFYPILLLTGCAVVWFLVKLRSILDEKLVVMASAGCVTLYSYLPVLWLVVVSLSQCQEVAGESWLVADMTEKCWTGNHLRYTLTVTLPILVLLPAGYFFAVLCLFKPPKARVCRNFHKYLTAGYTVDKNYWEIYRLIREIVLAALSLAYPFLDSFSSSILLFCIFGFSLQSDIKWSPYQCPSLLLMNVASYLSAAAITWSAVWAIDSLVVSLATGGTMSVLLIGSQVVRRPKRYVVTEIMNKDDFSSAFPRNRSSLWMDDSRDVLNVPPPSFNEQRSQFISQ